MFLNRLYLGCYVTVFSFPRGGVSFDLDSARFYRGSGFFGSILHRFANSLCGALNPKP